MKRMMIALVAAAVLMVACGTVQNDGLTKEERRAQTAQKVAEGLSKRHYTIEAEQCYPMRGAARRIDYGYEITVHGDTLKSNLPYFGRAYNIPYGGGKGLRFDAIIKNYEQWRAKKNMTHIVIYTDNEEDVYIYTIEVFDNGNATIDVRSREREQISFSGQMKTD